MPWKETCPMDERKRFISDWMKGDWNISELCRNHGISRPTAYKWLNRFEKNGEGGLAERSRAPIVHPNAVGEEVLREILALKGRYTYWGPKKLRHRLQELNPERQWPATSTFGEILKRNGLIQPRGRRLRVPEFKGSLSAGLNPNDVWAADFKGWFRTRDGSRVDPLTITDVASRFLLKCRSVARTDGSCVKAQFTAAFREFGMPHSMLTDNGAPFSSRALLGLSRLSVWLLRLGIMPERIRKGHPEENGTHERMHRTLKQETATPPAGNPLRQDEEFEKFRRRFNEERPHEGLSMATPSSMYQCSPRAFPERLPEFEYAAGAIVRRVRLSGAIKWLGEQFKVSRALTGEWVGLTEVGDGEWAIELGPLRLGVFDERKGKFDWN